MIFAVITMEGGKRTEHWGPRQWGNMPRYAGLPAIEFHKRGDIKNG